MFKIYRFLQKGDIINEFTPFYVIFKQYEISSLFIFCILDEFAKNIRKLSVITIFDNDNSVSYSLDFSIIILNY